MEFKSRQTLVLVLLIVLPVVVIIATVIILRLSVPRPIEVPEVTFLDSTEPVVRFVSGIRVLATPSIGASGPGQTPGGRGTGNIPPPPGAPTRSDIMYSLHYLDDGRIIAVSYPVCYFFDTDGNYLSSLELEYPSDEFIESMGVDVEVAEHMIDQNFINATTFHDSGQIYVLFLDQEDDLLLLTEWDINGDAAYITELNQFFSLNLYIDYPNWTFNLDAEDNKVIILEQHGHFVLIDNHQIQQVRRIENLGILCTYWGVTLSKDYIYAPNFFNLTTRHGLDGLVDWEWLQQVNPLIQPPDQVAPNSSDYGSYGESTDGDSYFITQEGVAELNNDGSLVTIHGASSFAENLVETIGFYAKKFTLHEVEDGWLLLFNQQNNFLFDCEAIRTDIDFNIIEEVEFVIPTTDSTSEPEVTETGEGEEAVGIPFNLSAGDFESFYPNLVAGDFADPRIITRDFHVIQNGYRAVDHTVRRVITTDHNLEVTAVLDRSDEFPNGLWQSIDACRIDSEGNVYLLDRNRGLVQVLNSEGNYVRRHTELGMDLFGTEMEIQNIHLDSFDRLWVVGKHRIYVLDRYGNLARIFERRGAPYNRSDRGAIPTEHTPLGYTILPTTDPLGWGRDVEEPVVLDVGEIGLFGLGGGAGRELFYVGQNSNDDVVVYDWDGDERGQIDVRSLMPTRTRQFVVGQDGFLYVIYPESGNIYVLDPLGMHIETIDVTGLPTDGWTSVPAPGGQVYGPEPMVRCFVDYDGRLVVLDTSNVEILVIPLREGG